MDAVERAERSLEMLEAAVKKHAYDCECQVGGVDALSLDTDYLQHALRTIKAGWSNLRQGEAELARLKAFADEVKALDYTGADHNFAYGYLAAVGFIRVAYRKHLGSE